MNEIIKQELWRSVGVFWIALVLSLLILKEGGKLSLITSLISALIITLIISLIFIIIRKRIHNGKKIVGVIVGTLLIISGILFLFWELYISGIAIIILGIISFIYGLIKFSKSN